MIKANLNQRSASLSAGRGELVLLALLLLNGFRIGSVLLLAC